MENDNSSPSTPRSYDIRTYIYTYTYSFTDPSPAQVRLNDEFVMKRAKLQYTIKSISYKLHKISKNIINYKSKDHIHTIIIQVRPDL